MASFLYLRLIYFGSSIQAKHVFISWPSYYFKSLTFAGYMITRVPRVQPKLPLGYDGNFLKKAFVSGRSLSLSLTRPFFCSLPSNEQLRGVKLTSCLTWQMTSVICMKCTRLCQKINFLPSDNNNHILSSQNYYLYRLSFDYGELNLLVALDIYNLSRIIYMPLQQPKFRHNDEMRWNTIMRPDQFLFGSNRINRRIDGC